MNLPLPPPPPPAPGPTPPADIEAREHIRSSLDQSLIVEASAGTGKTHELIARLTATLLSGAARIDQVAVLTYTRKAAGELKLRLRLRLDEALLSPDRDPAERARAEAAIAQLETARVGTIHSFCGDLLREHPVEAGIDPGFVELSGAAERGLLSAVFSRFIQDSLQDPPEGIRRALVRPPPGWIKRPRPPLARLEEAAAALAEEPGLRAPWRDPGLDLHAALDEAWADVLHFVELLTAPGSKPDRGLRRHYRAYEAAVAEVRSWPDDGPDYLRLESLLHELREPPDAPKDLRYGRHTPRIRAQALINSAQRLERQLTAHLARTDTHFAAQLQHDLLPFVARFEAEKERLGYLRFTDLIARSRRMLVEQPALCRRLQARFTRIFIDEFQDTGPDQVELLLRLTAEDPTAPLAQLRPRPGALFLVGDPKQSIYGFRGADLRGYQQITEQLHAQGVRRLRLTHSFRATAPLQALVNAAFSPLLGEGYAPLLGGRPPIQGQDSVVALPLDVTKAAAVRAQLPVQVAAFVRWLLDSGWVVREADGEPVPIRPEHIAILLRSGKVSGSDAGIPYADALERQRIPQALLGDRQASELPETQQLLAAALAIEWPSDNLAVFSTLHGPLLSLPAGDLWRYQAAGGRLHPLATPPDAAAQDPKLAAVAEALATLAGLHQARNQRPVAETLQDLFAQTGAHVSLGLGPGGRRAIAQLELLLSRARRFDDEGGLSFRGFVTELRDAMEAGERSPGATLEDRTPGVRILTAHTAKGLEFPVVILGGVDQSWATAPDRWVDREAGVCAIPLLGARPQELAEAPAPDQALPKQEALRLCYVAATRARELLVVPTFEDGPSAQWKNPERDYWLKALSPTLYYRGDSDRGRPHPQGPEVWRWRTPAGAPNAAPVTDGAVTDRVGFLGDSPEADAHVEAFERWREAREDAIYEGEAASLMPIRLHQADKLADPEPQVAITQVQISDQPGPGGLRFGGLMHQLLAELPLDADRPTIEATAALWGRVLHAPDDEQAEACRLAEAALALPLLARARAAPRCHRALPILIPTPMGQLVDTRIDLCFQHEGGWTLVDFKTGGGDPKGRSQLLSWAAHGLRAQLDTPQVTAVLLQLLSFC